MELLTEFLSSPCRMFALFFTATFIGMSKTGMQGINTITIPIMALAFGAKPSTGVILPMLCFADLIAVIYYRRAAEWRYVLGLLPAAVAGFFLAIAVDKFVPAGSFGILMAFCIFLGLVVMFWTERGGVKSSFVDKWWYGPAFGLMGGFTTMIGNAAGPVMSVYLLSTRLPKYAFVGTAAWFFLLVNYIRNVPVDLEEAAYIDGCTTVQAYVRIVLPLLKPMTSTVIVLNALWIWNDFQMPLMILNKLPDTWTLPLFQYNFKSQYSFDYNMAFASYLIAMIPVLIAYICAQKHIVEGLTAGAVKS